MYIITYYIIVYCLTDSLISLIDFFNGALFSGGSPLGVCSVLSVRLISHTSVVLHCGLPREPAFDQ